MYTFVISFCLIFVCISNYGVSSQQDVTEITNATEQTISTSSVATSTVEPTPNISCEAHNKDCKACVKNSKCYYCSTTEECNYHFEKGIVDGKCDMSHAYFFTCNANMKIIFIIIGVLGGIVLLIVMILCCYCCCKKKGVKISKDDIKWARQREERKQIAAERRRERSERTEEIRKKYGLVKDSNPYQKFDA